jgi:hypothetical protein
MKTFIVVPFGNVTTTLRVEALDSATDKTYQLHILVNISLLTGLEVIKGSLAGNYFKGIYYGSSLPGS